MFYRIIVLSYRTIHPENIAQFRIFYHTLSDGLQRARAREKTKGDIFDEDDISIKAGKVGAIYS